MWGRGRRCWLHLDSSEYLIGCLHFRQGSFHLCLLLLGEEGGILRCCEVIPAVPVFSSPFSLSPDQLLFSVGCCMLSVMLVSMHSGWPWTLEAWLLHTLCFVAVLVGGTIAHAHAHVLRTHEQTTRTRITLAGKRALKARTLNWGRRRRWTAAVKMEEREFKE